MLGRLLLRLMGKLSNHDLELVTPRMNLYLLIPVPLVVLVDMLLNLLHVD